MTSRINLFCSLLAVLALTLITSGCGDHRDLVTTPMGEDLDDNGETGNQGDDDDDDDVPGDDDDTEDPSDDDDVSDDDTEDPSDDDDDVSDEFDGYLCYEAPTEFDNGFVYYDIGDNGWDVTSEVMRDTEVVCVELKTFIGALIKVNAQFTLTGGSTYDAAYNNNCLAIDIRGWFYLTLREGDGQMDLDDEIWTEWWNEANCEDGGDAFFYMPDPNNF